MKLLHEPLSGRSQAVLGVVGVVGVAAVWEAVIRTGLLDVAGLPLPTGVLGGVADLLPDGTFWDAVLFTLGEWMLGLAIATGVGVLVGGLMGAFRSVFVAFEWPVEAFRVLPSVAVGPILVLLIGQGMLPLALTVALSCVWPILLNTMYGVRSTDTTAVMTAKTFGNSDLAVLRTVKIPSALPFAFTGVRIAASIGLLVAVSAELLIGNGTGIGGYILENTANATNLDIVYAATLVAGVLGVAVNLVMAKLDDVVFGWKKGLAQ
ncbi:ABC transporter permease [Blastococcus sp. TF02A-26]|uniref:ABC transporter permease n=1 Tax=Blastococcus sp. TF02A-26 TaxID=2250577 RepID=UPI000DE9AC42|nr:ABC transporter permease [Blastococcus sp. TF02A-26]RBY87357.1 nitrate ABC transporter permease [Blastococcus sp. TF02A-26]